MGWQLGGKKGAGARSDWKGAETRPLASNGRRRWPEIAGGDGAREPSSCFPDGSPTPELRVGNGKDERGAVLVLRAKSPQRLRCTWPSLHRVCLFAWREGSDLERWLPGAQGQACWLPAQPSAPLQASQPRASWFFIPTQVRFAVLN